MAFSEEERGNLTAYLDGELDEEATSAIEAKISVDAEARAEMEQLRHAWSMLDFLPRAQPSPDFTNRTMERLSLERMPLGAGTSSSVQLIPIHQPAPWKAVAFWAAVFLAAVGLGASVIPIVFRPPAPSTSEADEAIIRHLRVLERWHLYPLAEDLDFLKQLNRPEYFGDENNGNGF